MKAGRVDTIVIYKVDRLTRSLSDFSRIVDVLDTAEASFVSITQSFNTTTSMGRLTLNMLLSFAQFEREVTGERIRDKIAASKRKGMWMGGPVPLGYEVRDRRLIVDDTEAELVRHIYRRYIALNSVAELVDELTRDGHRTKVQHRASGPHKGGCPFRRGTLYHLLANRIYLGDIVHKGDAHPGEHEAIVPQPLWDEVRAKFAERGPGLITNRGPNRSQLTGLIHDGLSRPMTLTHAVVRSKRYRYYVTRDASAGGPAWRVGAHDLERVVAACVSELLLDRTRIARMVAAVDPRQVESAVVAASEIAERRTLLDDASALGIRRIELGENRVGIIIDESGLLRACGVEAATADDATLTLEAPVQRIRRGHELRLIIAGEPTTKATSTDRDPRLASLLAEAVEARDMVLAQPERSLKDIAIAHRRCRKRLAKLVRLSWLAPDIVQGILEGEQPRTITPAKLREMDLPVGWHEQRVALGIA